MSKIITHYRWFNVDENGGLCKPRDRYIRSTNSYHYIDDKYESEEAALIALSEYHGNECYASDDYVLVKTYYVDSNF